MLKTLLKRKIAALIATRITSSSHITYGNNQFHVRLNRTGTVISTSPIKYQASQKLHEAAILYSLVDPTKEEEIIVWMRMQSGLDKQDLIDFVVKKFNVAEDTAEKIFIQAFPDGLDFEEEKAVDSLEELAMKSENIDVFDILDIIDFLVGDVQDEPVCKNTEDYNIAKVVISSLLRRRNLLL